MLRYAVRAGVPACLVCLNNWLTTSQPLLSLHVCSAAPAPFHLHLQDLEERLSLDMAATAAAVKHVKVLTIHGTADKVIPVEDGRKFAAALPGNRLVIVEGADHNFRGNQEHLAQLKQAVLTFIEQEGFSLPSPRPDDSSSLASP